MERASELIIDGVRSRSCLIRLLSMARSAVSRTQWKRVLIADAAGRRVLVRETAERAMLRHSRRRVSTGAGAAGRRAGFRGSRGPAPLPRAAASGTGRASAGGD